MSHGNAGLTVNPGNETTMQTLSTHVDIDMQFVEDTLREKEMQLLLKDMLFISTYAVKLKTDKIFKDWPGLFEFLHSVQVSMFAALFWQLAWIMSKAFTAVIIKVAMFWIFPVIDCFKFCFLYLKAQHLKNGTTHSLYIGKGLTFTFILVGLGAGIITSLGLTTLMLPILYTFLSTVSLLFQIKNIINDLRIINSKEYPSLVRAQHRSQLWQNIADVITTIGVLAGIIAMFLLPAASLIATAPLWAPIVVPIVIILGVLFKLALQIAQVFKAPVETISYQHTATNNVVPISEAKVLGNSSPKSEPDSPSTSLESGSNSLTDTNGDNDSGNDSNESKSLLGKEQRSNAATTVHTSAFFYTKRRAETMAELSTLGEQQDYLKSEMTTIKNRVSPIEATEDKNSSTEAKKDQHSAAVLNLLEKLLSFIENEQVYDKKEGASQIMPQAEWQAGFQDARHHESDLQDLSKAAMLFLHDRARATLETDVSRGITTVATKIKINWRNDAPAYRMTLA